MNDQREKKFVSVENQYSPVLEYFLNRITRHCLTVHCPPAFQREMHKFYNLTEGKGREYEKKNTQKGNVANSQKSF